MGNSDFLTNKAPHKFIDRLISNLNSCDSFDFSVSFIKKAGLVLFLDSLENALKRGVQGRIVTSTYQNFTDIPSLEKFLEFQRQYPNFKCHLDYGCFGDDGFHTKGYIFNFENRQEIIIGSSNITRFALLYNHEWDVAVNTQSEAPFREDVYSEFETIWNQTYPLDADIVKRYQVHLSYSIEQWDMDYFNPMDTKPIRPNSMQQQALKEIARCRNLGQNRALVVAATGSGKTFLSAFDARNFGAKRLLFIVHKDMILEESLKTYQRVFQAERTYGLYVGDENQINADFIFASNQMMSRHLELFAPDEFDYIVIDEVHHAAASTYQKILSYFKPQFLLGLTATPDRMDGADVYELFGNNVPYDLRLRDALENDLIVPFRYYGISDDLIDYSDDTSNEGIRKIVMSISNSLHCEFIKEQIEKYRPAGKKLKCVGFCRTKEHARLMAKNMSDLGYTTAYLTGDNDSGERTKAFKDLEDTKNPLSIIFAVDILNEGIDIPGLNMVLFLRPTESATIFIQQLGRGLRKYEGKQYLTVLDFIANSYRRSVQIAVALGTLTKAGTADKRTIADHVRTDFTEIDLPGVEIHLDAKSKEEILKSIDDTNFNSKRFLKQDFENFKAYLKMGPNEYPSHMDFLNNEAVMDLMRFTRKNKSYYRFLSSIGQDVPFFSPEETNLINQIYWFLPLVRKQEYLILKDLIDNETRTWEELKTTLEENGCSDLDTFAHALKILKMETTIQWSETYHDLIKEIDKGKYSLSFSIANEQFKDWLLDMINYGLTRYDSENALGTKGLRLYSRNTSSLSLIGLNASNLFRMTGVHRLDNGFALFVDLKKDVQRDERLKYKDKFLSNEVLQWESQTGTTMNNKKGQVLIKCGKAHIFVRKAKKIDGVEEPFAYLGIGQLTNPRVSDNPGRTLLFDIILENPVPDDFRYDFGIKDVD